jgi:hypothetical protein
MNYNNSRVHELFLIAQVNELFEAEGLVAKREEQCSRRSHQAPVALVRYGQIVDKRVGKRVHG